MALLSRQRLLLLGVLLLRLLLHLKFLIAPMLDSSPCTSASVVSKGMLPTANKQRQMAK